MLTTRPSMAVKRTILGFSIFFRWMILSRLSRNRRTQRESMKQELTKPPRMDALLHPNGYFSFSSLCMEIWWDMHPITKEITSKNMWKLSATREIEWVRWPTTSSTKHITTDRIIIEINPIRILSNIFSEFSSSASILLCSKN